MLDVLYLGKLAESLIILRPHVYTEKSKLEQSVSHVTDVISISSSNNFRLNEFDEYVSFIIGIYIIEFGSSHIK